MIKTLFQYDRDDQNRPVFFKSDVVAHFVRGPVPDRTSKPVFFTGGPADRPSYTFLPISTSGGGDLPAAWYTLGVPAPADPPDAALASGVGTSVLGIEGNLYTKELTTSTAAARNPVNIDTDAVEYDGIGPLIISCRPSGRIRDPDKLERTSYTLRMRVYVYGSTEVIGEAVFNRTSAWTKDSDWHEFSPRPLIVELAAFTGSRRFRIAIATMANEGQDFGSQVKREISIKDVAITKKYVAVTVANAYLFSPGDQVSMADVVSSRYAASPFYDWMVGPNVVERVKYPNTVYVKSDAGRALDEVGTSPVVSHARTTIGEYVSSGLIVLVARSDTAAVQDTFWVMTFVTTVGAQDQEGPPSPVSRSIAMAPGDSVTLSSLPTSPPDDGGNYLIQKKRIYRSSVGADGATAFQFVDEIPIAQTSYTDSKRQVELGEALPSETWIKPPTDMHGLIACHNGMMAGISGSQICVSVPFQPHAWPVRNRFSINDAPVALGAFGETILALTEGRPEFIVGFEPESMRKTMAESKSPCLSARAVVDLGDAIVYPSTSSMVLADSNGLRLVAGELFEREEFELYNPETIHATNYNRSYLGFYTDDEDVIHGFAFDPYREASSWSDLNVVATAACSDPATGEAFIADEVDNIFTFDSDKENPLSFTWKSKTFATQKPWCPGYSRVVAEAYPVNFKLWANKQQPGTIDGVGGTTEATMVLILEKVVTSSRPFSLPGNYLATAFEIEVGSVPA